MKYRKLGNSELLISEVGFGSWLTFTDPQRKRLAISCVHRALDLGINFLDTANVYGGGAGAEGFRGGAARGESGKHFVGVKEVFPISEVGPRCFRRGRSKK